MVTILTGLVGGIVATVAMTLVNLVADDSPASTAVFWSKYVSGGAPSSATGPGLVLHLVYGAIAGAVFAVLASTLGVIAIGTLTGAVLWAVAYAILLAIGGVIIWLTIVLGQEPTRQLLLRFLVLHIVYGGVLGAWIALGPTV